ncbi:hypothetical protein Abr02nite_73220 [Paractinoplanes brasiliensis]|nr:hypothetical protein Abr02nite_73220 [Actinoplanes brasiliensis]
MFGPVVRLGVGAAPGGLPEDQALCLVPMTDLDARRMWRSLPAAPRLAGRRDGTPLEDLLLRLGRLAEDFPEIAELDLDPVLAGPGGVAALNARLRLAPAGNEPDPSLRALRPS